MKMSTSLMKMKTHQRRKGDRAAANLPASLQLKYFCLYFVKKTYATHLLTSAFLNLIKEAKPRGRPSRSDLKKKSMAENSNSESEEKSVINNLIFFICDHC